MFINLYFSFKDDMNNISLYKMKTHTKGIPTNTSSEHGLEIYSSSFVIHVSYMENLFGKMAKVKAQVTANRNQMSELFEQVSKGWVVFPGRSASTLQDCVHL